MANTDRRQNEYRRVLPQWRTRNENIIYLLCRRSRVNDILRLTKIHKFYNNNNKYANKNTDMIIISIIIGTNNN